MKVWRCLGIVLVLTVCGPGIARQQPASQPNFATASPQRIETDTYESIVRHLLSGDRTTVIDLIGRDPLIARMAWIRMLRDPNASNLARQFAEIAPVSSDSDIEMPALQRFMELPPDQTKQFLDWLETTARAEFLVTHHENDPTALRDLEAGRAYFKEVAFPSGEALCLRTIAYEYSSSIADPERFERADPLYKEAIGIARQTANPRSEILSLIGLARMDANSKRRLPQRMRQLFAEALARARAAGDLTAELHVIVNTGSAAQIRQAWNTIEQQPGLDWLKYWALGEMAADDAHYLDVFESKVAREQDAVSRAKANWVLFNSLMDVDTERGLLAANRAIEIARTLPYDMTAYADHSRPGVAVLEMLYDRAGAEIDLYRPVQAQSTLLEILDTWRALPNRPPFTPGEAGVLSTLAGAYAMNGDYPQAIERATESRALNPDSFQPIALLGRLHAEIGDLVLAEKELRAAARSPSQSINPSLMSLAQIHMNRGLYSEALKDMESLDPDFARFAGGEQWRTSFGPRLQLLALLWLRMGDAERSIELAKAAESLPPNGPPTRGLLGMVLIEIKRYREAEDYFKARLNRYPKDKEKAADAHKNLGKLYRIQKRNAEALEELTKARQLYRETFQRREEPELAIEAGLTDLQARNFTAARQSLSEALTLSERMQSPEGSWTAHAGLADLDLAEGQQAAAVDELRSAVTSVESVAFLLNAELIRSSFVQDKIGIYDKLIALLSTTDPALAFEYAEKRRAQAFLEESRRAGRTPLSESDSGLLHKFRDAEAQLTGKQKALGEQLSKPPAEIDASFVSTLNQDLQGVRQEHTDLLRRLAEQQPDEAHREGVTPVRSVAEVQRLLGPTDAVVEYVVTANQTLAFVVTPSRFNAVRLAVNQAALASELKTLFDPLESLRLGKVDPLRLTYDVPLAHRLYNQLFAPLTTALGAAKHLIIVPDDVLHYLPFESLAQSPAMGQPQRGKPYAEYRDVDWLVRRFSVTYAISATSLQAPGPAAPPSMLAFGDPKIATAQAQSARSVLRSPSGAPLTAMLAPLPSATAEARSVIRALSGHGVESRLLIGDQARETEFVRQAPTAGYIHVAAHALLNEQAPYYSAIMLAPDGESDGWLQTYEIMRLRLNARLVTLSACETGSGRLYKGEGLVGLRRAFLLAGAKAVAVTFWNIEDSAADFMPLFYGNIARNQPLAEALRNAKLQFIDSSHHEGTWEVFRSHPFFWATFGLASTTTE